MNIGYNGHPIIKYGNIAVTIPSGNYIADATISFEDFGFLGVPHLVVSAMHGSNAGVYAKIKSISLESAVISVCVPDATNAPINARLYWIAMSTLYD